LLQSLGHKNMIIWLVLGLIFPIISLLSGIGCLTSWWKRNYQDHPPIFIPIIGPVLLTFWILHSNKPLWLIPIVWICDVGTIAFIIAIPRLISDWWNTCSFTSILNLHSSSGIQTVILSFHSTGHYLLQKKWNRPAGETGVIELGEVGSFTRTGEIIEMKSIHGWSRQILFTKDGHYHVNEKNSITNIHPDYSIDNWIFEAHDKK
jgi:hypothetical protein